MPVDEVVDISRTRVRRRRQFLLRVGVPILGVTLVILSILGISLYSYQANRAGALALSNVLLRQLQGRIAREVTGYLSPAVQAALIARDMVARDAISGGRVVIEGFAASMLNQVPHLEGFYAADAAGNFIMVRRDPRGGTDTKLILVAPGKRQVLSEHLDATGRTLDGALSPGDDFDPRTRPWYQGALKTSGVYWTAPSVFYTTQKPGITAAIQFKQPGKTDRVFGVDIGLDALSSFLKSLPIGRTGRAAIVDANGDIIAAPELVGPGNADNRSRTLTDPALAAAYDRYRVEGYGNHTVPVGGKPFVVISSRLPAAGQNWILLVATPESDFTAFAENNSRRNFQLSLITIGLAALLGLLLVRQNRRTDRINRQLALQRENGARETRALSMLVAHPGLFDPQQPAPALTESLAETSGARRVSIWHFAGQDRILRCDDSFAPQQDGHVEGLDLSRSELDAFFAALDQGEPFEVADAAADQRTAGLYRLLMRPLGSRALSVLPIRGAADVAGAVMIEDSTVASRNFAQAVASIAAMRITAMDITGGNSTGLSEEDQAHADVRSPEAMPAAAEGLQAFSSVLSSGTIDPSALAAEYFPSVAAMIIRFDDALTLAKPGQKDSSQTAIPSLADEIAKAMQAIGIRYALPYMKLTGHHFVAATGCTAAPDPTAALRLADAALAAREACLSLLTASGFDPVFRIGIDFGSAFGSLLGQEPRLFNLWGDVIRTSELMAHSGDDTGSIQVSEAAYTQLRQQFLFRARGMFYVPRIGNARIFILAGRR